VGRYSFFIKNIVCKKALSIQAHPDKERAKILHEAHPELYPDPNHKPEMAIALTPFIALCQFRPLKEIVGHVENYIELRNVIGVDLSNQFLNSNEAQQKEMIKIIFHSLMIAESNLVKQQIENLIERINDDNSLLYDTIRKVNNDFPGDVGVFCIFMLNLLFLSPGEAIFLGANEPHAYISGDCVECMSCSDNVVRAACTSKYKDVNTLVEMLTYNLGKPHIYHSNENIFNEEIIYRPPINEFCLGKYKITEKTIISSIDSPSILLILEGEAELSYNENHKFDIKQGNSYFVKANSSLTVQPRGEIFLFRAYVNEE